MIVHRISAPEQGRSVWYDRSGRFDPINESARAVPMPFDPARYRLGPDWLSGVEYPDLLREWFPDMLDDLVARGFRFQSFEVKEFVPLTNEIVFNVTTAKEIKNDW